MEVTLSNDTKSPETMAAATKSNVVAPSRPTFVSEDIPVDSKLNCLVMLAKVVSPAVRATLIKEGHKLISSAKSMKDLGYSEKTYIEGPRGTRTANSNNYDLTLKVFQCDEGLYAHLLNKVSKLITSKTLPNKDHLGIMNWTYEWVCDALYPHDEETGFCHLGRPAVDAVGSYCCVMMGYLV